MHDLIMTLHMTRIEKDIEELKTEGPPTILVGNERLPAWVALHNDIENWGDANRMATALDLMLWLSATCDSVLLYDGTEVYPKHKDLLIVTEIEKLIDFYDFAAAINAMAAEESSFAADVLGDLERS